MICRTHLLKCASDQSKARVWQVVHACVEARETCLVLNLEVQCKGKVDGSAQEKRR